MLAAAARILTPNASKYLAALCGRLGRSAPARLEAREGLVQLPLGPCHICAMNASLALVVEAKDEASLANLQWILANPLKRVAVREAVDIRWEKVW